MKKEILDFKQGLSIQELEDRHELTILVGTEGVEGDKEENQNACLAKCCNGNNGG